MSSITLHYQNPDGSLYEEITVQKEVLRNDPVTKASYTTLETQAILKTGILQQGAVRISQAVYDKTRSQAKKEYDEKVENLLENVNQKKTQAVSELVKLGLSQEIAEVIVYK